MSLFHKHDWEDVGTYREYWYKFPITWLHDYRVFDKPVKWAHPEDVMDRGVKTCITQKCKDCKKYRNQWVTGEYTLGGDKSED